MQPLNQEIVNDHTKDMGLVLTAHADDIGAALCGFLYGLRLA
jgi:hypothetical protein